MLNFVSYSYENYFGAINFGIYACRTISSTVLLTEH